MKREKAIELLKEYATRIKPFYEPQRTEYLQAIALAIEALQGAANGEDLIIKGAQGIKDGLYNIQNGKLSKYYAKGGIVQAYEIVPSAEAVQGEWIGYNADKEDWLRTDGTPIFLVCDKCHGTVMNNGSPHWNYCPTCGTKMKPYKGGDVE